MKYRPLGKSGIEASVVAFGAWAIGGWFWGGTDDDSSIKAIHATIDAGINFLDTAPMYGFGESERVVGKAIKGIRDQIVLATKCGLNWMDAEGGEFFFDTDKMVGSTNEGEATVRKNLNPASIRKELEDSLTRLGTDRIDLYQTHWQEATTSIEDTMGELMKMKDEGKILAIGCSNVTTGQMEEYRKAGQLDSDQELFSMLDQKHVKSNLPYCKSHNIAYLAYSPIAQGLLTGKVGPDRVFDTTDQRSKKSRFSVENRQKVAAMLEDFKPIAEGHGITLAQLAIAWTVSQAGCTHALVGARNPQQVVENAKAGDVELTEGEISIINDAIAKHSPE